MGLKQLNSRLIALFGALIAALVPSMALASGGENVKLEFKGTDIYFLVASGVFGLLAVAYGLYLRGWVLKNTPGDEKMQEVGKAIRDGAHAYLVQQRKAIYTFVVVLGLGLGALYYTNYGWQTAVGIAVCFLLGVTASYMAGYFGMMMAVEANMRTAAAALTSYKTSLEVSFRAGAVAGMLTVGLGLLGATIIFFVGQADAMRYLVGFGFGGSLAALFMRVGGGIYTKAADVGADLVGKVEAGIPEDDPRNPAVIADNVGDNVGDCAGMAADVFESYEVTLVAAIVLGAATASIFPTEIWMKLVLFALMARGAGVVASIIGISMMKGSDDINSDPLKNIARGFNIAAIIAVVLTAGTAFVMMGGVPSAGKPVVANVLEDPQTYSRRETAEVRALLMGVMKEKNARDQKNADTIYAEISKELAKKYASGTVTGSDFKAAEVASTLVDNKTIKDLKAAGLADRIGKKLEEVGKGLDQAASIKTTEILDKLKAGIKFPDDIKKLVVDELFDKEKPEVSLYPAINEYVKRTDRQMDAFKQRQIQSAIFFDPKAEQPPLQKFEGYSVVSEDDPRWDNISVVKPNSTPGAPQEYVSFKEQYFTNKDDRSKLQVLKLDVENTPPAQGPAAAKPQKFIVFYGPTSRADFEDNVLKQAMTQNPNLKVNILGSFPVKFLMNHENDILVGLETLSSDGKSKLTSPHEVQGFSGISYSKGSAAKMKEINDEKAKNPAADLETPESGNARTVVLRTEKADWWRFFVCILFGVLMASAFERLTDYYVSAHKKPVQEVAGVASAGPAPMIIQGMALGKESSVFSVLAICVALVLPLLIFPPAQFGGYLLSFYGIALVGLGLLTTTGYILAMDTFGPISDNAQGVFEMSGAGHTNKEGAVAVQRLDAAGNTTKALTKGFAIATAVVAAVALFHSFVESAKLTTVGMPLEVPEIFVGLLIGGAAPFLFAAFLINAVGRASFDLINEVRRQFHADPGIMAGTSKPDYGRCVAIVTSAAQKELLGPGILAIAFPLLVVFGLSIGKESTMIKGVEYNLVGAQALGGFLAGTILSGQLLAVMLANSGGIWDNAKKVIEDGMHGGKGTDAHKAGVVCDTVGDPFKDTAGPALNPLIKVMNLVALLMAPSVIFPGHDEIRIAGALVAVALLGFAFWKSKQGSLSDSMTKAATEEAPSEA